MQRLLQGIEYEAGVRAFADAPTDNAAGVDVNDEGDIDEASPSRHISEVRHPKQVRRRRLEHAIDKVKRARRSFVAESGAMRFSANNPLQTQPFHQPRHRAAGDFFAFAF